ncbi:MAG: glycosyltransferase, partial [Clostridia bacterium]
MKKIIHYCWFGGKPLSELTLKCIKTWKKYLPDFEIKEWNESNFDINQCEFIKQAYEQKKWAFVADYTRFKVLEEFGGLYLDTDMEITNDISKYLEHDIFFGKEDSKKINAAVVWCSKPNNIEISNIVSIYENTNEFNSTGNLFDQSVPNILTNYFGKYNFDLESNDIQILNNNIYIYPMEYFYPLSYDHKHNNFTDNSCMIHHFDATWTSKGEQIKTMLKRKNMKWVIYIIDFFCMIKRNINIKDISIFCIPLIIFTIALLSYWPGIMTYDGNYQWNQIQNNYISNAHPFLSTFLPLIISKIWNSQTAVLLFQIVLFSFIWTCICKNFRIFINKNDKIAKSIDKKQYIVQVIFTILLSITPIIFVYSITFWKDIIYSYSLMALILMIYIGIKKGFKYRMLDLVTLSLILVIIGNYRHNGLIIIAIMIPVFFIIFFKKKLAKKRIIAFIIGLIVFQTLIIIPKALITKPSLDIMGTKESMSIFMTGALVKDEVPMEKEDLEYLNSLIDINVWKELYTPYLINSVPHSPLLDEKRVEETSDRLFNTFVKYAVKNPLTILKHYVKADALLWSPFPIGYVYIYDFTEWGPPVHYGFDAKVSTKFEAGKNICDALVNGTMQNKYIRTILYRPATFMYFAIILTILLVKKVKDKKYFMLLLPMLLNILSLAPVNLAQDLRYVY